MFTGIIEELGKVISIESNQIAVQAQYVLNDTKLGDSISVNGVCLTVTKIAKDYFNADISPETMNITALNNLKTGSVVNLERAMSANGRFGGHIVTGHIDGKGKLINMKKNGNFFILEVEIPDELKKYVVKKGSVTVNGISLTVADINSNIIKIAVIPHTYMNTNLKTLQNGEYINIETDILAKYVEKFLSTSDNRTGISMEFLLENGF